MTANPAEQAILDMLAARGEHKSICPTDAAKALAGNPPDESWRRSLAPVKLAAQRLARAGQIEILQQRVEKRREAREKLDFLDAELVRIEEQAELVREQAVLSTDPQTVSQRIDQITATLGGTSQWISEQQKIYGAVEDLLAEPPALSGSAQTRQSQ